MSLSISSHFNINYILVIIIAYEPALNRGNDLHVLMFLLFCTELLVEPWKGDDQRVDLKDDQMKDGQKMDLKVFKGTSENLPHWLYLQAPP